MEKKSANCPHCGRSNIFEQPSAAEQIEENLPVALLKAAGVVIIGALTGGIGALIAGGAVYADNVVSYINGTHITCGHCGTEFKV